MTIHHKITCDGCGNGHLFGHSHIQLGMRPNLRANIKDLHYCSHACLVKAIGNIAPLCEEHAKALLDTRSAR